MQSKIKKTNNKLNHIETKLKKWIDSDNNAAMLNDMFPQEYLKRLDDQEGGTNFPYIDTHRNKNISTSMYGVTENGCKSVSDMVEKGYINSGDLDSLNGYNSEETWKYINNKDNYKRNPGLYKQVCARVIQYYSLNNQIALDSMTNGKFSQVNDGSRFAALSQFNTTNLMVGGAYKKQIEDSNFVKGILNNNGGQAANGLIELVSFGKKKNINSRLAHNAYNIAFPNDKSDYKTFERRYSTADNNKVLRFDPNKFLAEAKPLIDKKGDDDTTFNLKNNFMSNREYMKTITPKAAYSYKDRSKVSIDKYNADRQDKFASAEQLNEQQRVDRDARQKAYNIFPAPSDYRGNIDLRARPVRTNEDGTISTLNSKSFGFKDDSGVEKQVLLPTIDNNGNQMTDEQAIAHYKKTNEHLGQFDTIEQADSMAQALHTQQENMFKVRDAITNGLPVQTEEQDNTGILGFFKNIGRNVLQIFNKNAIK